MICYSNGRIQTKQKVSGSQIIEETLSYPRGQSNFSSGLTKGTSDLAMKLPSTYTLAVPASRVYSDAFFIFA